jgi:hypothetical protein
MELRPLVVAGVAAGCIAAAGIGAYVAGRQNAREIAQPAPAVSESRPAATEPVGGGVAETEAVVTDDRPLAAPESSGAAAPAPGSGEKPRNAKPVAVKKSPAATSAPSEAAPSQPVASAPTDPNWQGLDRPWPPRPAEPAPDLNIPEVGAAIPPEPYVPPQPQYEDLVVEANSVIGLQIETPVTTERAQIEDRVNARVTRDVLVGGKVAVPAGTLAIGSVTLVERGGKVKDQARLGVRFHTLVMADASRLPIHTESIFREGEPPSKESVAKIGGAAAAGAILGAIIGGGRGAAIGGAAGAGAGTAATMAGQRKPAVLQAGTTVTVRLTQPVTVTVER